MANWLFRLSMPYRVVLKDRKIVVQNRKYNNLFEGNYRFRLTTEKYNYIKDNIAYQPDERFTIKGGEFFLYKGDISDNLEKRDQYFRRLTLLLDLCNGLSLTDNNSLEDDNHRCNNFRELKNINKENAQLLKIIQDLTTLNKAK